MVDILGIVWIIFELGICMLFNNNSVVFLLFILILCNLGIGIFWLMLVVMVGWLLNVLFICGICVNNLLLLVILIVLILVLLNFMILVLMGVVFWIKVFVVCVFILIFLILLLFFVWFFCEKVWLDKVEFMKSVNKVGLNMFECCFDCVFILVFDVGVMFFNCVCLMLNNLLIFGV